MSRSIRAAVATLLAHYFRKLGHRVLAIDLDHQGNFSDPLRKSQRVAVAEVPASALLTQASPVIPAADFVLVAADQGLKAEKASVGHAVQYVGHAAAPFARGARSWVWLRI